MLRGVRAFAVVGLVLVALSACESGSSATALGDTKAPAQLLRNEVASRFPADLIAGYDESNDGSEACGKDGVMRSWHSSQLMSVADDGASGLGAAVDDVVASLVKQGWKSTSSSPSTKMHDTRLTNETIASVIRLRATDAASSGDAGASIEISVNGQCVETDGPNSDEVIRLGGAE
jgi:hypothetical protein